MPKTVIKEGYIPKVRCDKRLQDEAKECAGINMMDMAEYVRAAIREKNERTRAK